MLAFIKFLLLFVEVIVGFLLVGVILLQRSKDSSMGLSFGSGVGETLFGARAGNVLQKITVVLAAIFFVGTIILARIFTTGGGTVAALPSAPAGRGGAPAAAAPAAPGTQDAAQPSAANFGVQPSAAPASPMAAAPAEPVPASVTAPVESPTPAPVAPIEVSPLPPKP